MEKIKAYLLWVLTPILFVAGYIWYLLSQNEKLKAEVVEREEKREIEAVKEAAKAAVEKSNDSEADFRSLADQYRREHGEG
jgi:hypothetical protein